MEDRNDADTVVVLRYLRYKLRESYRTINCESDSFCIQSYVHDQGRPVPLH